MNTARRPPGSENPEEPFVPDLSEGAETGLYLALLELFDEGLVITGDEVVLEANSAACRLLERDYRQVAGKPLADLFPSERDFLDARARLFIQGEMRGSLRVGLPEGRHRDLRFVAAARIRPGIHALILSPEAIGETGSERSYDDSASADVLWPRLAAALEQPVIVVDERDRVSAVNAAALRALGLTRDRLIGQSIGDCIAIDWPAPGAARLATLLIPGQRGPLSARVVDGPKPDWRLLILPPTAPAALAPAAPETADPLRPPPPRVADEGLLEHVFARNPLPTLVCEGAEMRILAANAAACSVYGYPHETLCAMALGDLRTSPGDGRHGAEPGIWQHRRRDGSTFDVDIVTYALDSSPRGSLTVVMHDLPEAPLLAFETRLRQAVDLGQLDMRFQPIVDVRDARVRGGEALLRWKHPQLGLIPFQRFAGVARDSGQLVRMGDWILHSACAAGAEWSGPAGQAPRVVVNIALEQLAHGNLAERVRHALAQSGLPAERLELDLDERVLNDEHLRLLGTLEAIAETGVRLAIDDYGCGPSSIPRLKRFPLRALKLAPQLVREVGVREDSEAVIEAISCMAGVLGLDVLARGVDTEAQEAFLSALGCHLQQGPLFGQPMTVEEFRGLLA